MKKLTTLTTATVLTLGIFQSAAATELQISTWAGPNHGVNSIVWPTWGSWIEEATDGRVSVNVVHDMGPPGAQMELIADGVADVTWLFHGLMPGRFELTKLPEFPTFKDFSSEAASVAYWRTHQEYFADLNEHRGVEVIGLGVHGPGTLFLEEPIERLDELPGNRVRIGGGVMADVSEALGLTGVALPPGNTYEAASQGVVDGAMLTQEGLKSFRLSEVLPNTVLMPGGFYRGSFSLVMNPDTLASLPEEDREALLSVSGERLSRLFGFMMDVVDGRGMAFAEEMGNTFIELPQEEVDRFMTLVEDLPEQWAEAVAEKGVDGEAALEHFYEQLEEAGEEEGLTEDDLVEQG
ncbi:MULTISPECIES: TRAP transporter substrate-binding protein [unclassified Halomonas]|uniref:TRAP transporter substrate-binding protein n=1 Tax=unclassified Halomonas TaxID=2609666 RepID=UPI0028877385|nr:MULTISPECIES: TRAP transporter substrate-binding protein [unclassified Halomonas]MDT0502685.1 TRAP transporter substrate-binding protein [Halomonas sp. PAR7]MDT0512745.1 TRAP transporter substrate-binding protein [Halomonas sp. LES1]MDT0591937.1 TRAP transporter substrate-binding protein [Halomonas sp. PAR8]